MSTETALGRATLAFTRKQLSRQKRRDRVTGADAEQAVSHALALVETMGRFTARSLPKVTNLAAEKKLACFFRITVGALIDNGKMAWFTDEKRRRYVLGCADFLAERARHHAEQNGQKWITPHVLELAADDMVEAKKSDCELPSHGAPLRLLGSSCAILADEMSGKLRDKQCAE